MTKDLSVKVKFDKKLKNVKPLYCKSWYFWIDTDNNYFNVEKIIKALDLSIDSERSI